MASKLISRTLVTSNHPSELDKFFSREMFELGEEYYGVELLFVNQYKDDDLNVRVLTFRVETSGEDNEC